MGQKANTINLERVFEPNGRSPIWTKQVYKQLLSFSLIYGFFFINFVDYHQIYYVEESSWYHLWLLTMYFAPYALIRIFVKGERRYFLGFGILVSLMNDGLWPFWLMLVKADPSYFSFVIHNWYTLSPNLLFDLRLGIISIPVYGWAMTVSLWARTAAVLYLLDPRRLRSSTWPHLLSRDQLKD